MNSERLTAWISSVRQSRSCTLAMVCTRARASSSAYRKPDDAELYP